MKKIIAWILLVVMCVSLFAGCKPTTQDPNPTEGQTADSTADLKAALAYIKTVYKNPTEKTPRDFKRIANVPVNGKNIEVVWTANVGEEYVKIVKGTDGMVTIDVNENSDKDVPYQLTATISNSKGESVSYAWKHLLPAANNDMAAIVEDAYTLQPGEAWDYEVTLTGVITRVNTAWSDDYQNITVTIEVAGAEGKPIECYRLGGDGAKDLAIGDTITVTGFMKNYNGKIEFDAGCVLEDVVKGEVVEAPSEVEQILKDAYALENNTALPYEATLTGKIIKINSPYASQYKNISVTIEVDGYPQYPMLCYRITGEGAESLLIGDTITVKGYIVKYEDTVEFDAGSLLINVEKTGSEVKAPTDPKQIVKDAYGLKENESLAYKATLTGKITKIRTPYDKGYKNVTVIMVIDGMTDKPIDCYRLSGVNAENIGEGDTITVTGWLTNYKGTIQFAQGCTLDKWLDTGVDTPKPEDTFTTTLVPEVVTAPKAGTAYKFFMNQKNQGKNYYLTGEMDGFYYQTTYDPAKAIDVYVETVSGGYRLYFMKDGVKNYLEIYRKHDTSTNKYHNNVIFTTTPTKVLKWNDAIKSFTCELDVDGVKTDFYFGTYSFYQTFSASDVARITGENAGKMDTENFVARLATLKETKLSEEEKAFEQLKTDYPASADATVTDEDFTRKNVYTVDGKKVNVVWTADNEAVAIVDNGNGTVTVKVTRGDAAVTYKLTATITEGTKTYTTSWNCRIPAEPKEDALPNVDGAVITIKQALEAGANLESYTTIKYKVTGEITEVYNTTYGNMKIKDAEGNILTIYGTYSADGETRYDALEVKPVAGDTVTIYGVLGQYNGTPQIKNGWIVEHTPGSTTPEPDPEPDPDPKPELTVKEILDIAYGLATGASTTDSYTLTGVITNVDTSFSEQYGNVTVTIVVEGYEDQPIQCFRLKGEGADLIDKNDTITVTGTFINYDGKVQFNSGCTLNAYVKAETPTPDPDPKPESGLPTEDGAVITIKQALEEGVKLTDYTTIKFKVTGEITEVYNTTYGNMKIKDAEGNILTIYGTYSADGETRYDALEVKPVAGDTVTIYGILGQYNGTAQIKNGWIVEHTPATVTPEKPEVNLPTEDGAVITIKQALEEGVKLTDYTTIKFKVTGVITEVYNTTYGNMYIKDAEGNTLTIYGTYSADGSARYDALDVKPVAGDTVTVYGILGQFNGTAQIKNGWIIEHTPTVTPNPDPEPEAPATEYIYTKVTSLDQLTTGKYVLVVNNGYAPTALSGTWVQTGKPTVDGDSITAANAEGYIWDLTVDGSSVTLKDANGTFIKPKSGNNNGIQSGSYNWNVVFANGTFRFQGTGSDTTTLACNPTSSNQFRAYKNGTIAGYPASYPCDFTLYKQEEVKPATIPAYVKVTSADALVTGKYVLVVNNGYAPTALSGTWVQTGKPTINGDIISVEDAEGYIWDVTVSGSSVTLKDANGVFIKPKSGNNNGIQSGSYNWNVVFANGTFRFQGTGSDTTTLACNPTSSNQFRAYKNGTIAGYPASYPCDFTLYVLGEVPATGDTTPDTPVVPEEPVPDVPFDGTYTYGSGEYSNVILNWGKRGEVATFLSPNAISYYAAQNLSYSNLFTLSGDQNLSGVPYSDLYLALKTLMVSTHVNQTTYGETRYLYRFTDCTGAKDTGISAFYSGTTVGPDWDNGTTWNREHCWPKSKTPGYDKDSFGNSTTGENGDLMTLRPVVSSINSSRSAKAYGVSSGYYDPNSASNGAYNLRGDVARIVLYNYVRWGNTEYMWGSDGAIESLDVLLAWMVEDPVDTWEMGRNDSVQSVTGTRNVFVDCPELAFLLFGQEIPADMKTPSKAA